MLTQLPSTLEPRPFDTRRPLAIDVQRGLLIHALEWALKGESVAAVPDAQGYASPSNFIAMFRKALEQWPADYWRADHASRVQG
jgi:AraC-like DNA-binding protein